MKQQVRIIGGKFKGKKISFPLAEGLRPTPDRIKETLFNWLMHRIHGTRCLDAFAGSGALGFEAFSRGADEVVLVEQSAVVYQALACTREELKTPHPEKIHLIQTDILHYLKTEPNAFDIIFIDPPFATPNHFILLDLILSQKLLNPGGLIYIESPCDLLFDTKDWKILQSKHSGAVYYSLLSTNS